MDYQNLVSISIKSHTPKLLIEDLILLSIKGK